MEWIKCSDRMPRPYFFVLVFEHRLGEPSPTSIARWDEDCWQILGDDAACFSDLFWDIDAKCITHWMPLPQPPEVANE